MNDRIITWLGKPIDELTRDELINALKWAWQEVERQRQISKDYSAMSMKALRK